jgi:hypothetical protein
MSVMGLEAFRPLIKPWPWGEDAFKALAIAVLPPVCLLAIGLLATSTAAPRGTKGKPDEAAPPRTPTQEPPGIAGNGQNLDASGIAV